MNIRFLLGAAILSLSSLAQAEMVMVANPSVNFSSISSLHVTRLFFGQTDLAPGGGKAVPIDVAGPLKDRFAHEVLKKSPEQIEKYWARMIFSGKAKTPREVKPGELKAAIANTPGAISYLDRSDVDGSVKVITITDK